MHESGMIRKLVESARNEAQRQGGDLRGITVRLGALAGGTAEHVKEHFEIECDALGMPDLQLSIVEVPEHPAGVEITSIEIRR